MGLGVLTHFYQDVFTPHILCKRNVIFHIYWDEETDKMLSKWPKGLLFQQCLLSTRCMPETIKGSDDQKWTFTQSLCLQRVYILTEGTNRKQEYKLITQLHRASNQWSLTRDSGLRHRVHETRRNQAVRNGNRTGRETCWASREDAALTPHTVWTPGHQFQTGNGRFYL